MSPVYVTPLSLALHRYIFLLYFILGLLIDDVYAKRRDAIHKHGLCSRAVSVCIFVCPSVCHVCVFCQNKRIFSFVTVG